MITKNKYYLNILLILILNSLNSYSQPKENLRQINIEKFKEKFDEKFCKSSSSTNCKTKWNNMRQLLEMIKNDNRLTNIDIAAFFLATVYTETEIKNFAPTREIKCKANKNNSYWEPDPKTGQQYYGRGWVQLTYKENYIKASSILKVDFLNKPDLLLEPKYAYEVMYLSTMNGWLEYYRADSKGKTATKIPIKLTDFLSKNDKLDYSLTRAVINANGGKSERFEFKKGCYIPPIKALDASVKNMNACIFFENALRYSISKTDDEVKLKALKETRYSAGCFWGNGLTAYSSNISDIDTVYFNLDGFDDKFIPIQNTKSFPLGFNTDVISVIDQLHCSKHLSNRHIPL